MMSLEKGGGGDGVFSGWGGLGALGFRVPAGSLRPLEVGRKTNDSPLLPPRFQCTKQIEQKPFAE